jgi:hypothetical protein
MLWDAPDCGDERPCPMCRGRCGDVEGSPHVDCPCCDGDGVVPAAHYDEILAELDAPYAEAAE